MNEQETEIWRQEREIYRRKLVRIRERKGLSQVEAGQLMDHPIGQSFYWDIENCDGDLTQCCSLNQAVGICKKFDAHPRDVFCEGESPPSDF